MCGVTGQIDLNFESSRKAALSDLAFFEDPKPKSFQPNYNTWTGMNSMVVANDSSESYQNMQFGLTPHWANKKLYFFNARSEGKLNQENNNNFKGPFGIFQMPAFKSSIKSRRCLIPINYFFEGSAKAKLSEPYLIQREDKQPFLLGGIWDEWTDQSTGEITRSYSVITTPANDLLRDIGHHRAPMVISDQHAKIWLNNAIKEDEFEMLFRPFNSAGFTYYSANPNIKSKKNLAIYKEPIKKKGPNQLDLDLFS